VIEPPQSESGQSGRNWRVGTKLIIRIVPLIAYAATIVPRVAEVRAFSAGAPQSGDVTALALYYHARPPDA